MSEEFERQQELKLEKAIRDYNEMSSSYYSSQNRTTLDGEWEYDELLGVLTDETDKKVKEFNEKNQFRAVKDKELTYTEFIVNKICDEHDLIELYNDEYDKHRNDTEKVFNIHHFENRVHSIIDRIFKDNTYT